MCFMDCFDTDASDRLIPLIFILALFFTPPYLLLFNCSADMYLLVHLFGHIQHSCFSIYTMFYLWYPCFRRHLKKLSFQGWRKRNQALLIINTRTWYGSYGRNLRTILWTRYAFEFVLLTIGSEMSLIDSFPTIHQ